MSSDERFAGLSRAAESVGRTVRNVGRGPEVKFYGTEFQPRHDTAPEEPDAISDGGEITSVGAIERETADANEPLRVEQARREVSYTRILLTSGSPFALSGGQILQRFSLLRDAKGAPTAKESFAAAPDDAIGLTTCPLGILPEVVGSVSLLRHGLKREPVHSEPV